MIGIYYDGKKIVRSEGPMDKLPKALVLCLVVGHKQVLHNFEFYVFRKDFKEWGGCNCSSIADQYRKQGHTVFAGEWAPKSIYARAFELAKDASLTYSG